MQTLVGPTVLRWLRNGYKATDQQRNGVPTFCWSWTTVPLFGCEGLHIAQNLLGPAVYLVHGLSKFTFLRSVSTI